MTTRAAGGNDNPPDVEALTGATFSIIDTKLYPPVVTLSTPDDNNLLQQLKTRFKRTIKWNKYCSNIYNQTISDNLNYLIDSILFYHLKMKINFLVNIIRLLLKLKTI